MAPKARRRPTEEPAPTTTSQVDATEFNGSAAVSRSGTLASLPGSVPERANEVRVRRIAQRQDLKLRKNRRLPGKYGLLTTDGYPVRDDGARVGLWLPLDAMETWLLERDPSSAPRQRTDWSPIMAEAQRIVESYSTPVTLRQLFYRLVSRQLIDNNVYRYNYLSRKTAEARRDGWFPDLIDQTSDILSGGGYSSPQSALRSLCRSYRRDHTEGQEVSIYLGVEKNALKDQLWNWFGDLGVSILALGGYASQTFKDEIRADVERQERPAILVYAGDHDGSGDDIYRDLVERTDCWDQTYRVALFKEQVAQYDLPENPGKDDDPRSEEFMARNGYTTNVQVELDALDPVVLRSLYQSVIEQYWDDDAYAVVLSREDEEREALNQVAEEWNRR